MTDSAATWPHSLPSVGQQVHYQCHVGVAADGWDIRARWFGVVICRESNVLEMATMSDPADLDEKACAVPILTSLHAEASVVELD